MAPFDGPSPLLLSSSGPDWLDFDVQDMSNVWIGATSGVYLASNASTGDGSWALTQYLGAENVVGVGLSQGHETLYVSTAGLDGTSYVYSFDTASGTYNNDGSPVITAAAGFQFRGVAMSPIFPSGTPTPTGSPSVTPTMTATSSATPSNTPSSSASVSLGASSSTTGSSSASATGTPVATITSTPSSTATGTPTVSARSGFGTTGFAMVRLATPGAAYSATSMPLQTAYIDDYSGCTTTGPCALMHTWAAPSTGTTACTLPPQIEAGRLSRSSNGALLSFYCVRNATGVTLGATYNSDGVMATINTAGVFSTAFTISKLKFASAGYTDYGIGAGLIPNSAATEDGSNAWTLGDRSSGAQVSEG